MLGHLVQPRVAAAAGPRRPRKIVAAAVRISGGSDERLKLGNIDIERDWGWAPEYVDAMHRMLEVEHPQDFVVATGPVSLSYFVENCFSQLGLDWRPRRLRPRAAGLSRTAQQRSVLIQINDNGPRELLGFRWQAALRLREQRLVWQPAAVVIVVPELICWETR